MHKSNKSSVPRFYLVCTSFMFLSSYCHSLMSYFKLHMHCGTMYVCIYVSGTGCSLNIVFFSLELFDFS